MRTSPLLADFIHARGCKPFCEKSLTLPSREDHFMSTNEKGTPQSRTYTVNDIAAILGIGRASAYKLANSGLFKTIRIGNMIRISRKSFEDWLKAEGLDDET